MPFLSRIQDRYQILVKKEMEIKRLVLEKVEKLKIKELILSEFIKLFVLISKSPDLNTGIERLNKSLPPKALYETY